MSFSEKPNLVELYDSNYRDPVAELRKIADEIERGEYGAVGSCAVVMLGDQLQIFRAGPDCDAGAVALLLQAGLMTLGNTIVGHGR